MSATLRPDSPTTRATLPEGYVEEQLHCNHDGCSAQYVLAYHADDLRAERETNSQCYSAEATHETVLEKIREAAADLVAASHSPHDMKNYVWAGLTRGWIVVEQDLTAAGI
jgi:hypothetical protein